MSNKPPTKQKEIEKPTSPPRDQVLDAPITEEMKRAYLDYAMSVIVARALPDARDGLKPVHRRIVYSMYKMGLNFGAKHRKCATVVGDVMGKYHPHGDLALYDALTRMGQDFSLRYPLIDGQGNFGSIDNDPPAAMRYTEARLAKISQEILADIERETVEFTPNYDASREEPKILPAKIPNLLLNGSDGIAVGMATKIPPHNLSEVTEGLILMIENAKKIEVKKEEEENFLAPFDYDITVEDLIKHIKGPDFPTGGSIYNIEEITQAYATGKGKIVMRAEAKIEEIKGGKYQIVVSEIPYQLSKAYLVEKIADLVKQKKLEGISDLRDESDKSGMRIVIELKKDARPKFILNRLYKYTPMQSAYHVNMVALLNDEPKIFTLKMFLEAFLNHRYEIVLRRTLFDLKKAKERLHILEGLKIALDHLDEVIATIKKSKDAEVAKTNLMEKFKLSEIQATAILDMQLRRLAALERKKIEDEYKEIKKLIDELEIFVKSPRKILSSVKKELLDLKETYGDKRRTKVYKQKAGEFSEEDLIANVPTILTITKDNYIKRSPVDTYKTQQRGGKGVIGITTKEGDVIMDIRVAQTHDRILFFTNKGRVFDLRVYDIPEGGRTAKGQAIVNLIDIEQDERVTSILSLGKEEEKQEKYLLMATKDGTAKKTLISEYENIRSSGLIAIKLTKGDELIHVKETGGDDQVILVSKEGRSIRFKEKDIRPTGRATVGVRGIKLKKGDEVVSMDIIDPKGQLLTIMENGFGKRTKISNHSIQGRGGQGVKAAQVTKKTGAVVESRMISNLEGELIVASTHGQIIKVDLKNIRLCGRATQGVKIIRLDQSDTVASTAFIEEGES